MNYHSNFLQPKNLCMNDDDVWFTINEYKLMEIDREWLPNVKTYELVQNHVVISSSKIKKQHFISCLYICRKMLEPSLNKYLDILLPFRTAETTAGMASKASLFFWQKATTFSGILQITFKKKIDNAGVVGSYPENANILGSCIGL